MRGVIPCVNKMHDWMCRGMHARSVAMFCCRTPNSVEVAGALVGVSVKFAQWLTKLEEPVGACFVRTYYELSFSFKAD